MVIMSVKWTLKKIVIALAILASVAALTAVAVNLFSGSGTSPKTVETAEQRAEYLQSLGWEIEPGNEKLKEVVIPEEFDEMFETYNALQKKAGFDLENYKGKTAQRYTYRILNYPSAQESDIIKVDLLVLDGKVIGGSIYSPRLDGFMSGLVSLENAKAG